jgi:hypothetical protein
METVSFQLCNQQSVSHAYRALLKVDIPDDFERDKDEAQLVADFGGEL